MTDLPTRARQLCDASRRVPMPLTMRLLPIQRPLPNGSRARACRAGTADAPEGDDIAQWVRCTAW